MWWGAAWFTERRSSTACVCTRVQHGNEHSRLGLGAVTARVRRVQAAAVAPRTMLESFGWEVKVARRSRFAILAKRVAGGQQHGGGRGACTDGAQTRAHNCLNHDCPSMDSSRAWTHACACKATQEQKGGRWAGGAAARLIVLSKGFLAGIDAAHRRHEGLARLHLLPAQLLLRSSSRAGWMASRPGLREGAGLTQGSTAGLSGSCDRAPAGAAAQVAARRPLETPARPVLP